MATDFIFVGQPLYAPPAGDAVDFTLLAGTEVTPIDIAIAASVTLTAALLFDIPAISIAAVDVAISAEVPVTADTGVVHGVGLDGVSTIAITATLHADHGVVGTVVATLAVSASVLASVLRYELRGDVRLGGVLVNRRVRAYSRATGELIGQVDTAVGQFAMHTGFAAAECYLTPIDMDDAATDWQPPTANRVMSVLANDTP